MIFMTLGSQKFPFNRLLQKVDELVERGVITEQVFAQTGVSDYVPKHFAVKPYLDRDSFGEKMRESHIVITHGGTGTIVGAIKLGKKVIAVPRLSQFGEHVDDHQIQLIRQFDEQKLILPCYQVEDLEEMIGKLPGFVPVPYQSNTQTILDDLTSYLQTLF